MTAKQVLFDADARHALHEGVNIVARATRITLGPKGRNVAIETKGGLPIISPDGVTVAKAIELDDRFQNMGAQLVKQAASKTSDVAGDGTTSSTVLAQALIDEGLRLVAAGASPLLLKRALDRSVDTLVEEIQRQSIPIAGRTEIAQVATISAQDPEVGEMLATIMDRAGRDAVISIEEGKGAILEYEMVEGMQFDHGYSSPYFVTDTTRMVVELDEPAILITDQKIGTVQDLLPLLEKVVQSGKTDLLILADVTGDALATLVVNELRGTLHPLAVKAPGFGDRREAYLHDIATLTGGTVLSEKGGRTLQSAELADLGHARKVRSDKETTLIVEGRGDRTAIQARIAQLKQQVTMTTSDYEKEQLQQRAAKLSGGVAVIRVGAPSEPAMKERTARVDDALHATRAAIAEGILPGGGVAYLNLRGALDTLAIEYDEDRIAFHMLRRALEEPTRQIVENAGMDAAVVVDEITRRQQESGNRAIGFDVMQAEYGDMLAWGVIDPAMVVRAALQNAVSVAGMILSTDVLVAEEPETPDAVPGFTA